MIQDKITDIMYDYVKRNNSLLNRLTDDFVLSMDKKGRGLDLKELERTIINYTLENFKPNLDFMTAETVVLSVFLKSANYWWIANKIYTDIYNCAMLKRITKVNEENEQQELNIEYVKNERKFFEDKYLKIF